MRPSGATAVASAITRAAPPTARAPRCTRCQSFGTPSSAEYWHMGETTMRFLSDTLLIWYPENSLDMAELYPDARAKQEIAPSADGHGRRSDNDASAFSGLAAERISNRDRTSSLRSGRSRSRS